MEKKIEKILETRNFSQGEYVEEFEHKLANYLNVKADNVVAVSSGTAALHLALLILKPREVSVPACTFISCGNVVKLVGAELTYTDVDSDTWNTTDATIGVDLMGNPVGYNPLIEDAAESLGSVREDGKKCGTLGKISCLSFFENKIITSGGEGGALVCEEREHARLAKLLRQQGKNFTMPLHKYMGFNYRMTEIQAVMGIAELDKLDKRIKAKRRIFRQYYESCPKLTFQEECGLSNRWFTAVLIPLGKKEKLISTFKKGEIYWKDMFAPLYYYPWLPPSFKQLPMCEILYKDGILLPSFPEMSEEEVSKVCTVINDVV